MGLKIETWNVAYRKKTKDTLLNDTNSEFIVIDNGYDGWAADPFVFEKDNEVYLFAEIYSYKHSRGIIAYSKYNKAKNTFEKYKTIIVEDYHLSYPCIFEYNNNIYMMPEASESDSLYLYRAVEFPEKWEKLNPLLTGDKLVDTTPVLINNKLYALSYKLNVDDQSEHELILLEFDGKKFTKSKLGVLSKDVSSARPGGNFIKIKGELYRVSQDCDGEYGKAINFMKLSENFPTEFKETLIKKIQPGNLNINNKDSYCGIHTYNTSENFEVIDLKSYKNSYVRLFYRILNGVKGCIR